MSCKKNLALLFLCSLIHGMEQRVPTPYPRSEKNSLDFERLNEGLPELHSANDENLWPTLRTLFANESKEQTIVPIDIGMKYYFVTKAGHLFCLSVFAQFLSAWAQQKISDEEIIKYDEIVILPLKDRVAPPFRSLISKAHFYSGPNCYSTALIAAGLLTEDQFRYMHPEEFLNYISTYFRKHENSTPGDIVLFYQPKKDKKYPWHAGYYVGGNIIFHKQGYRDDTLFAFDHLDSFNSQATFYKRNCIQYSPDPALKEIETYFSNCFKEHRVIDNSHKTHLEAIQEESLEKDQLMRNLAATALLEQIKQHQECIKTQKDNK